MTATKILWGQLFAVFAIVLITMWAATQWVAWKLGYHAQLGPPWLELGHGRPVYIPFAFFWWWYAYDAYAPELFVEGACIAASGGMMSIVVAFGMSVWRGRDSEDRGDLRLRSMGRAPRDRFGRPSETGRCGARPLRAQLSSSRRSGARALLCTDTFRQGRGSRHPHATDLAG